MQDRETEILCPAFVGVYSAPHKDKYKVDFYSASLYVKI